MTTHPRSAQTGRVRSRRPSPRLLVGLAVAAGVLFVVLANAHFVYVAVDSQPDCVAHLKAGDAATGSGLFSAAKPSC